MTILAQSENICIVVLENIVIYNYREKTIKTLNFPSSSTVAQKSNLEDDSKKRDHLVGGLVKISPNNDYLAAISRNKVLVVWRIDTWDLIFRQNLIKRPMAIDFVPYTTTIVVADKTGDVFSFDFKSQKNIEKEQSNTDCLKVNDDDTEEIDFSDAILGHFSMLLDMCMTIDGKYIITCDRDEKIRVSHYPNSYSIHSFCLGHQEFVSCIVLAPHLHSALISGSGDGTIRLWNYNEGSCSCVVQVYEHCNVNSSLPVLDNGGTDSNNTNISCKAVTKVAIHKLTENSSLLAVSLFKFQSILLYEVNGSNINHLINFDIGCLPLDMCWTQIGEIIILTDNPTQPLAVYKYKTESKTMCAINEHPCVKFGCDNKELLRLESEMVESVVDVQGLYKQRYDNMADYLKKKQERLDAKTADPCPAVKKKKIV